MARNLRTLKDLETNTILVGDTQLDGKVEYMEREVIYKKDLIAMIKDYIYDSCKKVEKSVGRTITIREYGIEAKLREIFDIEQK